MKKRTTTLNIALIVVFCIIGITLFTENVRLVQIIGLLVCGAIIGASLTNIIVTLRGKK